MLCWFKFTDWKSAIPISGIMVPYRGYKRYVLWPIHIGITFKRWKWTWFDWHGWEMGHDGLEQHVLGWAYHIGPISIYFGK